LAPELAELARRLALSTKQTAKQTTKTAKPPPIPTNIQRLEASVSPSPWVADSRVGAGVGAGVGAAVGARVGGDGVGAGVGAGVVVALVLVVLVIEKVTVVSVTLTVVIVAVTTLISGSSISNVVSSSSKPASRKVCVKPDTAMRLPVLLPMLSAMAVAIAWYKFASCSVTSTDLIARIFAPDPEGKCSRLPYL